MILPQQLVRAQAHSHGEPAGEACQGTVLSLRQGVPHAAGSRLAQGGRAREEAEEVQLLRRGVHPRVEPDEARAAEAREELCARQQEELALRGVPHLPPGMDGFTVVKLN